MTLSPEGGLNALRRTLRQLLTERFGDLPESVRQRIESTADPDRLPAVQVLRIAAPEQLPL